jgi:hypothetical protein
MPTITVTTLKGNIKGEVDPRGPHPEIIEPVSEEMHLRLTDTLATLVDQGDRGALRLGFVVVMSHPKYGKEAKSDYATALRMFKEVVLSVAVVEHGVAFSIGTEEADDLPLMLDGAVK